jgi:hypothetical protein
MGKLLDDPDLENWLDRIVSEYGESKEHWLAELTRRGMENLEDSLMAKKMIAEMQAKNPPAPREELIKLYGSEEALEKEEKYILSVMKDFARSKRTGLHITLDELDAWLKTWGTDHETEPPQCHK